MATIHHNSAKLNMYPPSNDDVHAMVLAGLQASPKRLPCKLLYDKRGSELFEQICELPEYYPTRTESSILRNHIDEMAEAIGSDALLIEFGSGAGAKCRLLLDALDRPAGYVPIEISREILLRSAEELQELYPDLPIHPLCADYTRPLKLPTGVNGHRRVAYFPGSTIGNFEPDAARQFLAQSRTLVGQSGGMLLGVDLRKDVDVLCAAYNDEQGVTAAFNLNLLHRVNRELGADFEPDHFTHEARWNEELDRIEMHLVSARRQDVCVNGTTISFDAGESIHTENSYKHTPEQFEEIGREAGWHTARTWTDFRNWFSVQYLSTM
jgi:dimethylhistidine N-methyltransferase